ncbi:hypothetical protein MTBLM5_270001 [Magnetospirillum sp. LM-5]|nr:hypothetical protein MTBLM5_270001 [Magnetospirillum sp. LM-5]
MEQSSFHNYIYFSTLSHSEITHFGTRSGFGSAPPAHPFLIPSSLVKERGDFRLRQTPPRHRR